MVDQIYEFINQVRQWIEDRQADEEDSTAIEADDDDNDQPGQLTEEGDIIFEFKTTPNKQQQQQQQHSKHSLNSRIYQQILKSQGYQLLDVYNSNALYLCKQSEMKRKVMAHMKQTNAYSFIEELNETNPTCVQQHLDRIVQQVTTLLNDLVKCHCINDSQFRQMNIERSKVRLDYLFFLPDLRQRNVPFQPIMVCSLGPTIGMARYISRLLQPIYDQVALSTTFFKETDAVHAVEMYANKGLLLPTTLFATFHIHDLCTIVSHEEMIQALDRFLNEYYKLEQDIHGLTTDTILKLIRLILQNQFFIFQNKIFRQIKGGAATGSPLTILLMNIYMFYWQEDLVQIMGNKNEIFGRCFDQVFLTWNGSKNKLRSLLHATINKQQQQPSAIQITTSIGKKINYMDAQIGHINGRLQTKINHDFDTEPRALPYVSNHPRLMYSTLIRASLIRAILCCQNMIDFNNERHDIEETFNTNGYTWDYINEHVEQFFREFNALELMKSSHLDQSKYEKLRYRVFEYDQEQMHMKIKQRKAEQQKEKWYISCTFKGETLNDLQEDFKNIWKDDLHNHLELRNSSIEIIDQPKYPSNTK